MNKRLLTPPVWVLSLIALLSGCVGMTTAGYVNPLSNASISCVTSEAQDITSNSATLRGLITVQDAIANVANVWFLIGTNEETIETTGKKVVANNIKLSDLGYDGPAAATANGLQASTTYYYMIVGQVDGKVAKGNVLSFTTKAQGGGDTPGGDTPGGDTPGGDTPGGGDQPSDPGTVSIATGSVSAVKENSADISGTITIPSGVSTPVFGIIYATDENPTGANATKVQATELESSGKFTVKASNLVPGTKYYYKAYYTDGGIDKVGDVKDFTTAVPSVSVVDATDITTVSAKISGSYTTLAQDLDVSAWFLWGTSADNLKTDGTKAEATTGQDGGFSANVENLSNSRTYYYMAVVSVLDKEFFSDVKSFTTDGPQVNVSIFEGEAQGLIYPYSGGNFICVTATYEVVKPGTDEFTCGFVLSGSSFDPARGIPQDADIIPGESFNALQNAFGFYKELGYLPSPATYYYAAYAGYGDALFYSEVKSITTKETSIQLKDMKAFNVFYTSAEFEVRYDINLLYNGTVAILFCYKEGSMTKEDINITNITNGSVQIIGSSLKAINFSPYTCSYNGFVQGKASGLKQGTAYSVAAVYINGSDVSNMPYHTTDIITFTTSQP